MIKKVFIGIISCILVFIGSYWFAGCLFLSPQSAIAEEVIERVRIAAAFFGMFIWLIFWSMNTTISERKEIKK